MMMKKFILEIEIDDFLSDVNGIFGFMSSF